MVEQATRERVRHVPPVAASVRMHTLPDVAMKIALGAVAEPMPGGVKLGFEGDLFVINQKDYEICARAGKRVKAGLPAQITATKFLEACGMCRKYVSEEIFRPGVKRVIYYPSLTQASAFYRCTLPSLHLSWSDKVSAHVTTHRAAREAQWYDVVVVQLDHSRASHAFIRALKEMGKKIVFEFDDDFESLEPWHPGYEKYRLASTQEDLAETFKLADAVTVTTHELASRYKKYHSRIEVIPNFIPIDDWPKAEPHGLDEFRVLWAGSVSHFGDLGFVSVALWSFLRERDRAKVVFFGRAPQRIPDDIQSRVDVLPFGDFGLYPMALADIKADVAIAPLADNEFNLSKSALKLLEYGACGYPIIASDVGPYHTAALESAPNICVSLCSDGDGWLAALRKYHDEPDFRRWMADNSLKYARRCSIGANIGQIEQFFANL